MADAIEYLHDENALSQDEEIPETGDADTATVTFDRELDYRSRRTPTTCWRRSTRRSPGSTRARSGRAGPCGKPDPRGPPRGHALRRRCASTASGGRSGAERARPPRRRPRRRPSAGGRIPVSVATRSHARRPGRSGSRFSSIVLACVAADQVTKELVRSSLAYGEAVARRSAPSTSTTRGTRESRSRSFPTRRIR